jgi:hypothetical protein
MGWFGKAARDMGARVTRDAKQSGVNAAKATLRRIPEVPMKPSRLRDYSGETPARTARRTRAKGDRN